MFSSRKAHPYLLTSIFILGIHFNILGQKPDLNITFDRPAEGFTESLPLGNGRIGALVFGGVKTDRIALNEISLWSGGPQEADIEDANLYLESIQKLLIEGKNKEAQKLLQEKFVAKGVGSGYGQGANEKYGSYQTAGDLFIHWLDSDKIYSEYSRVLDVENADATTRFKRGFAQMEQVVFTDFVNDILWIKLTSSIPESLNFDLELFRKENANVFIADGRIVMKGQLPSGKDKGMSFITMAQPITKDGEISEDDNRIKIRNATECIIKVAIHTNYDYFSGNLNNVDLTALAEQFLAQGGNEFNSAFEASKSHYQALFNKSRLYLESTDNDVAKLSTADRLINNFQNNDDNQLLSLYYNFGRYLLISSSRPGLLPANLQGLWATEYQAPWNGDYHININLQMNYWPAEITGLGELAEPLHRFTKSLMKNGEKTAKAYYNAEGWVAHVISNPWFYTSPGEGADWGSTLTGGAWLVEHIWEHYRFTKDKTFLKEYYPVMKGAAKFIQSILIEEPNHGWLVTAPSNSPEHSYITPDGFRGNTVMGPTMDMQIARELFNACINASSILKVDKAWREEIESVVSRLAPNQIGKNGDLNEWLEDWEDGEITHRHISHLYGLHPYDEINLRTTPELARAAEKTLIMRGDESTGWSMAWKINFWARLGNGNKALELLEKLLKPAFKNNFVSFSGGGTYPNLFCAHPPFQIDGNFGGTAGIAEMLLQSSDLGIEILPALPDKWPTGSVTGLHARGGFVLEIQWHENRLTEAKLKSLSGEKCKIYLDEGYAIFNSKGKNIKLKRDNDVSEFKTKKGEIYIVKSKV